MTPHFRANVPADQFAVFSDDGRVFFDLDALIAQWEPIVAGREFAANITKDPLDATMANSQRMMLDMLRQSRDSLALDFTFDN